MITEPVVRLRRELGYPGMVVLQFALGGDPTNPHLPANHEEQSVVYTGTHDNDTTRRLVEVARRGATARGRSSTRTIPRGRCIGAAWSSRAALAIAPLQDVLGLGNEARMNLPGTEHGNWEWRYAAGDLTSELAAQLRALTSSSRRARSA